MYMKKLLVLMPALFFVPMLTFAQDLTPALSFFAQLSTLVGQILVPLVFAIALVGFFWGLFKTLIWGGADSDKREEGKKLMLWSIIALTVMVLIYGIIYFLGDLFGIAQVNEIRIPRAPSP